MSPPSLPALSLSVIANILKTLSLLDFLFMKYLINTRKYTDVDFSIFIPKKSHMNTLRTFFQTNYFNTNCIFSFVDILRPRCIGCEPGET